MLLQSSQESTYGVTNEIASIFSEPLVAVVMGDRRMCTAYFWYDECRVPCKYCAPQPLPHVSYCGCPCHSCAAEPYLADAAPQLTNPLSLPGDAIPQGSK